MQKLIRYKVNKHLLNLLENMQIIVNLTGKHDHEKISKRLNHTQILSNTSQVLDLWTNICD